MTTDKSKQEEEAVEEKEAVEAAPEPEAVEETPEQVETPVEEEPASEPEKAEEVAVEEEAEPVVENVRRSHRTTGRASIGQVRSHVTAASNRDRYGHRGGDDA